ncbi:MAG: hypothetical protein JKY57_01115 [Kordiimonadaceae bacterium]|nr:hypothetical protein [Kordiimonadaceae bacterium]
MTKALLSLLTAMVLMCGATTSAFGQKDDGAAVYDGTGVKPPKELLLKEGITIGDVRLPKGTKINNKKSIILGGGTNSYGKIIASVRADSDLVMRFFLDNMPADGWELISEFRADDITLTFQKPTRVVVMLIERGKRSTDLRLTLTPRS